MNASLRNLPVILLLLFPLYAVSQTSSVKENEHCIPCEELMDIVLPDVTVLSATKEEPERNGQKPFCRVLGLIGKENNFELLLPDKWNGRFAMGGGGGFVGNIQNAARYTVHQGFATSGTDTGHQGNGIKADWAYDHLERQVNFGHLAVHRTAEVSKSIINIYYCRKAEHSYFIGCSRGGGQAMMEAQRYPEDFDGIVAGAPAFNWPEIGAEFIQNMQYLYPDAGNISQPVVTRENLKLLQKSVLDACDTLDGVRDLILNDPRDCPFDLGSLPLCPGDDVSGNCLTGRQLNAIGAIYEGVQGHRGTIYPGFPFGGENEIWGWINWITGPNEGTMNLRFPSLQFGFGTEMYKYLIFNDHDWNYLDYDFSTFSGDTHLASSNLNATSTDYSAFRDHGGRMIIYHGWEDAALSPLATIAHYEAVKAADPAAAGYLRLYLLPGVLHCGGGPGPDRADWLQLVINWVEKGVAPERVIVSKYDGDQPVMSRPVFPYPRKAVFNGTGDPNLESSFH